VDHDALTSFFRELFESIGLLGRGPRLRLRPHREVRLALEIDAAFERTLEAIPRVLGANVLTADRTTYTIEAGFGLVNQEHVRARLEPQENGAQTLVRIEAHYPASLAPHERSAAVDALADALESSVGL
jgi:hypothetical protein